MKNKYVIKLDGKEWESALNQSFKKRSDSVNIPGFRKGKVTKEMYIKHFGVETLYMDAVDFALPVAYEKFLKENTIDIAATPGVDVKSVDEKALEIEFSIVEKPEIKLGEYKNLKIKKETVSVSKEEVKKELQNLQEHYAEVQIKENGKVENGDITVINFEGFLDKKPFEGGKAENHELEVGSNSFIPGFEEGLIGMETNEEKDIELTFPQEYPAPELASKKVIFKVKVNEIKRKVLPEINKDFFEDINLPNVNSKETLEKALEEEIKQGKEREVSDKYIDEVLKKVTENAKFELPDEMVEDEVDRMIREFSEQLKLQGFEFKQYLEMIKMDEEKIREEMKKEATSRVSYRLILEKIAEEEKIEISDADASKEADNLAEKYKMEKEEFLKSFGGLDVVKYDMKVKQALELIQK